MTLRARMRRLLGPLAFDEVEIALRLTETTRGVLVDVGAHYGTALAGFVARGEGWEVHAFEPDPANRERLTAAYAGRIHIDDRAVTDHTGDELDFFTSPVSSGISGLSKFHESHVVATRVRTVSLMDYLAAKSVTSVDVLKIDTEGFDLFVLRGMDWAIRPKVVICEFEDRKTLPLGYDVAAMAGYLVERGYVVLVSEWHPIIEYGGRHRWRRLRRWPFSLPADCWGNLIAVEPAVADDAERIVRSMRRKLCVRRALEPLIRLTGQRRVS